VFSAADITPTGPVPITAYNGYEVERDGELLGLVTAPTADLVNRGIDPLTHVVDRLNELEREWGFERLANELSTGITL
jgi:hypothetical protein